MQNIDDLFYNFINSNYAKMRLKESTISTYYRNYENYIKSYFSNKIIDENTILEFTEFLLFKLSRKTVNDILTLFSSILKINKIDLEIYKPKFQIPTIQSLAVDEWERLEDYCISNLNFISYVILLSLYTGIRPGELCASQKKNLNFIDNTIKITDTLQRIKNLDENATSKTKIIIDTPKSLSSIRDIPLIDDLTMLGKYMYKDIKADCFLITGTTKYMEVRTLENKVNEIYHKLNIENKNLYSLRHSFATNFYYQTGDIKTLAELLGHKDIKTTYRYIFTSDEKKRQGVNSLVQNRNKKFVK